MILVKNNWVTEEIKKFDIKKNTIRANRVD